MKSETRLDSEENCGHSNCWPRKSWSRIKFILKRSISSIAIFTFIKHLVSFILYVYDIVSDALVSHERLGQGHYVWGGVIIFLMFLPNLLFLVWMILGSRRDLKEHESKQKELCDKDTGIRVVAGTSIQCVTVFSFILAGYSTCFPTRKHLFGIPLDNEMLTGNVNFFKAAEGYFEAFPQSIYQISITMRDVWPPTTNQILSLVLSIVSLSLTATTFLFYQHEDIDWYDPETNQPQKGTNNPKIIFIVPATLLYILLNIPRIIANGLILAISPLLGVVMFTIEIIAAFVLSHYFIRDIRSNEGIGGFILAITNCICPNAPVSKIGMINITSSIYTITKLILLYPTVYYLHDNKVFVRQVTQNPDLFRCFPNVSITTQFVHENNTNDLIEQSIHSPRPCNMDEEPNQILFHLVIPTLIGSLIFLSLPSGFMISVFMRSNKLDQYQNKTDDIFHNLSMFIEKCTYNMVLYWRGRATEDSHSPEIMAMSHNSLVEMNRGEENIEEENSNECVHERSEQIDAVDGNSENLGTISNETKASMILEKNIVRLESQIEKPSMIFRNVRRVFSPQVVHDENASRKIGDIHTWQYVFTQNKPFLKNKLSTRDCRIFKEMYPDYSKENNDPATLNLASKISMVIGNITLLEIDAIVCSVNLYFRGGNLANEIRIKAGRELDVQIAVHGSCPSGQSRIVSGFNLPSRHVIYTNVDVTNDVNSIDVNQKDADVLQNCYDNTLKLAVEKNLRVVAFPCLATGVRGHPSGEAADIALSTTRNFLTNNIDKIDRVIFILHQKEDINAYEKKMQLFFPVKEMK